MRAARRTATMVALALAMLALPAAPASAAPAFDVDLTLDENDYQELQVSATGGQYRLCYEAACTADLAFDAGDAMIEAALNDLPTIAAGGGSVSAGGNAPAGGLTITFDGGPLAGADVELLSVVDGTVPLSGRLRRAVVIPIAGPEVSRSDERVDYVLEVRNSGVDPLSGEIVAEIELPAGLENDVIAAGGPGWSCSSAPAGGADPASVTCTRADALAAGASYPRIDIAAGLGEDAAAHAVATASVSGGGAATADDSETFGFAPARPFEILGFDTEVVEAMSEGDATLSDYTQAGGHPYYGLASFFFPRHVTRENAYVSIESVRKIATDLPRGFVGNALAVPELCPSTEEVIAATCPSGSAVGMININVLFGDVSAFRLPIYAIEPEFGRPAQFAFAEPAHLNAAFTINPRLRPEDGYAITLEGTPPPTSPSLRAIHDVTLCNFGARLEGAGRNNFKGCKEAGDAGANSVPLITNPTRCAGEPPAVKLSVDSYESLGDFKTATSVDPSPTGCELVDFEPEMTLEPTSREADSPTGMDVELTMPTDGLESPTGISQANLKRATVTLPEGMVVNPSAAQGLGACTAAQVGIDSDTGVPDNEEANCPLSSKIGTVAIETPLIRETLTGDIYVAKQGADNPFDSLVAMYMVFSSKKDGVTIKLAGEVSPDPETGQLTVRVDDNPEAPFSSVKMHFFQGPRSPLINPPKCGVYEIEAELTPWSAADPDNPSAGETVEDSSSFRVTSGPGGGPCPAGRFEPRLDAASTNPVAGAASPFFLRLRREDGSQRFDAIDAVKPPLGLTASLKGIPYCSEAQIAQARSRSLPLLGGEELSSPSCPAASQVGTVFAGSGAGPHPLYVDTGRVYFAGPYRGAPVSLVIVTPAVAGPFDLGNVVVRTAIHVDPVSTQLTAISEKLPTILHGIPLNVRDVLVRFDRPNFTQNPTSCAEKQVTARVGAPSGASKTLVERFQVGGCRALGFEPRVGLRLFGGVKGGKYQGVRAVIRPKPGDANISRTVVRFPKSAFVAQEHIRTVCTRVQFAADACPQGSIYGRAVAYSPLLDYPLRGNVYLRSSDNLLPDAVADLRGPAHQPIKVEVAIRNDSVKGALRNTVQTVPDAPVSYFRLQMFGKEKGLIVNSRNICGRNQARVVMNAHNGRRDVQRVNVFNKRCKKLRRARRKAAKRKAKAKAKRLARVSAAQRRGR